MCTPEDPNKEAAGTLNVPPNVPPVGAYPTAALTESDKGASKDVVPSVQAANYGGYDNDEAFIAAPPPPDASGGAPPPPPAPAPASTAAPAAQSSASAARPDVTADDILSNLDGSAEVLYTEAFAMFPGGLNGFVGLDCAAMRDFLCTNSAIGMDDIDLELLKVASPDEGLSRDGFLHLLREFSVSDGDAISQFMGLSSDGESLAAEECRSGLLLFAQQHLHANYPDDKWERIFNTVMWDANASVSMEQFLGYTKLTGRIVRLMRYAQV